MHIISMVYICGKIYKYENRTVEMSTHDSCSSRVAESRVMLRKAKQGTSDLSVYFVPLTNSS